MKRNFFLAVLVSLFAVNGFLLLNTNDANASVGITKGIKGKINGVATCHCPDDTGNCNCAVAEE